MLLVEQLELLTGKNKKELKLSYSFDVPAPMNPTPSTATHTNNFALTLRAGQRRCLSHTLLQDRTLSRSRLVLTEVVRDLLHHLNQPIWGPERDSSLWDQQEVLAMLGRLLLGANAYSLAALHIVIRDLLHSNSRPLLRSRAMLHFLQGLILPGVLLICSNLVSLGVELSDVHYDPIVQSSAGEVNWRCRVLVRAS